MRRKTRPEASRRNRTVSPDHFVLTDETQASDKDAWTETATQINDC